MKNTMKKSQIILALFLSVFLITWFASCAPEARINPDYIGTWEKYSGVWHSEYTITSSKIIDVSVVCEYTIRSSSPVVTLQGYTLFLCECTKGTEWTPKGNYYAVAIKMDNGTLSISCPLDYTQTYTSLSALEAVYDENYDVGSNVFTICTKVN